MKKTMVEEEAECHRYKSDLPKKSLRRNFKKWMGKEREKKREPLERGAYPESTIIPKREKGHRKKSEQEDRDRKGKKTGNVGLFDQARKKNIGKETLRQRFRTSEEGENKEHQKESAQKEKEKPGGLKK